jgi:hypothetical protein
MRNQCRRHQWWDSCSEIATCDMTTDRVIATAGSCQISGSVSDGRADFRPATDGVHRRPSHLLSPLRDNSRWQRETREVDLPVLEFVRRWCLHILPKGFTKTRYFGGWSNYHCQRYLAECRELLNTDQAHGNDSESGPDAGEREHRDSEDSSVGRHSCPTCGGELDFIQRAHRTSWRDVSSFHSVHRPAWYQSWETSG